jgi:SAM-dependent methyltransferase
MVIAGQDPCPRAVTDGPGDPVIWHDLECGGYRADLPLWRELAEQAGPAARILDIGAGSGRVTLELAAGGHSVTALDLDPGLLRALDARAAARGLSDRIETVCADACTFQLERRDFALCLVPMQTIQLLGGSEARVAFLRRALAHLQGGAVLACAIVTEVEPFDCTRGDLGPSAETTRIDGRLFSSRATRVHRSRDAIRIERARRIITAGQDAASSEEFEHDVIDLDRLGAAQLQREGRSAGLGAAGSRAVGATEEHVGSLVVEFHA